MALDHLREIAERVVIEPLNSSRLVPLARELEVVRKHVVRVGLIAPQKAGRDERCDDDEAEHRRDREPQPRPRRDLDADFCLPRQGGDPPTAEDEPDREHHDRQRAVKPPRQPEREDDQ